MIFDKLSPKTDFISKIISTLDILNGNVLYLTHEMDQIKKIVTKLEHKITLERDLQKQVDDYFEADKEETSPQTESVEQ